MTKISYANCGLPYYPGGKMMTMKVVFEKDTYRLLGAQIVGYEGVDKPIYVVCQSGLRSYIACRILAGNGFTCYNFTGGFRFYDAVRNDRCLIEQTTACGMDK